SAGSESADASDTDVAPLTVRPRRCSCEITSSVIPYTTLGSTGGGSDRKSGTAIDGRPAGAPPGAGGDMTRAHTASGSRAHRPAQRGETRCGTSPITPSLSDHDFSCG